MNARCAKVLGGLAALVLLTGCARQFTRERYDMIRKGVDNKEDVRRILGKPASDLGDQWFYDDPDRHISALIYFDASGVVSAKQWPDSETGSWEGENPHANPPPAGEVRERNKKTTRIDRD